MTNEQKATELLNKGIDIRTAFEEMAEWKEKELVAKSCYLITLKWMSGYVVNLKTFTLDHLPTFVELAKIAKISREEYFSILLFQPITNLEYKQLNKEYNNYEQD